MFTEQLKSECDRLGLTQAEVAALLDVSPRAVWKWLHGDEPELAVTREGILARLKKAKEKVNKAKKNNSPFWRK